MVKIGVFDSGIGGKSIVDRLQELFPGVQIIFTNDTKNMPYGSKTKEEIISLTDTAIQPLLDEGCNAIVIACNTATTNAIPELRSKYSTTHFVGLEPMIKPASELTTSGNIAVLATPSTLSSARYNELKNTWAKHINVTEPNCSDWAELIEQGRADEINLSEISRKLKQSNVDVVVLGCTHYHWIKDRIQAAVGHEVAVLEPSDAIGARLDAILGLNP